MGNLKSSTGEYVFHIPADVFHSNNILMKNFE
jgi:hypothetical protein